MHAPQFLEIHWTDRPTLPLTTLHAVPASALSSPLDVRNFLPTALPDEEHTLHLTLAPSPPPPPVTGNLRPPVWHVHYQPANATDRRLSFVELSALESPSPSLLEDLEHGTGGQHLALPTPARGSQPLALGVHAITRTDTPLVAEAIAREAWIRQHRLNRMPSSFVAHWFGLYAGLAVGDDGVPVPVYAALVSAGGVAREPEHRNKDILAAYKQLHSLGVVHRAAYPPNWFGGSGEVRLTEFGRAHVRRRGFGINREMELNPPEWLVDEIEFDRLAAAETTRVEIILEGKQRS